MTQRKLAIIQARMSSSRLPGKVLLDIAGKPMLQHVIERTRAARMVDQVVLATTSDPSDNILEHFCQEHGILCYRGSMPDVLDRFYRAADQFQADVVVRLTADCPLLDPDLIDLTLLAFLGQPLVLNESGFSPTADDGSQYARPYDFAANRLPPPWQRTLPIGMDVEVCTLDALRQAWKQADQLYQREHVMPFLYEGVTFPTDQQRSTSEWYIQHNTTPRGFNVALLNHHPDFGSLRLTVDTPADLELVRHIFTYLDEQASYRWQEVVALLESKPELSTINADVIHKSAFDVDKRSTQP